MKKLNKKLIIIILAVFTLPIVAFVNFDEQNFEIAKNLDIFHTLFRELNLYYVDKTDPGDLVKKGIDEMLKSLDPYTVFIPESKMEDYKFMTTGKYGGIGALIRQDSNFVIIAEPYEDFPAFKAGLRAGDKIIGIDGKSTEGKTTQQISELLKGEPKTPIKLKIKRPFVKETFEKELIRQDIKINSVPYFGMLNETTGYIRLSNFTESCSKDVKKALLKLKKDHHMQNLVFDLRGNPGGLLVEAVFTANLFIKKGQEIVSTKGKVSQWNQTYNTPSDAVDANMPMVVLVNRGSASASEIVSGAIQDLDRGILIGTRTFGKGLVQTTRNLSYNSKLKVTTAKYYIPSGRCIQALDYTHRNEDGSVGRIPDSLITKFKTTNGRVVYDGGGILPDIEVKVDFMSKISTSLYLKNLIFDYATKFKNEQKSIPNVKEFKITDDIYNDFTQFLANKDFDYKLESEDLIDDLEETVKKEKYHTNVAKELEALRKKLAHDKNADLQTFKEEISSLLYEEIISRYYFQKGRAEAMLVGDKAIEKAIELLNNSQKYDSILTTVKE